MSFYDKIKDLCDESAKKLTSIVNQYGDVDIESISDEQDVIYKDGEGSCQYGKFIEIRFDPEARNIEAIIRLDWGYETVTVQLDKHFYERLNVESVLCLTDFLSNHFKC